MRVAGDENQIVLDGEGGNPHVIFGDASAGCFEGKASVTIVNSGIFIALKYRYIVYELINFFHVSGWMGRFPCLKIEFSKYDHTRIHLNIRSNWSN